ncbi:uncharacterized protein TNCT_173661 [Trichonephila clavata]|uniref:DNA-directed DNA polymerase n=1 Tax=Trichonephila clavata TaxID=2740835 RepID=A0A8X6HI71_TRICU|nr:uncharacterized protein TNCT_173661 [Trichonephila clavata]
MSQALPYGDFKWISPHTFNTEQILSIHENSEVGYVFEVDLEYPTKLHNLHSDYPLAPEKLLIKKHMISPTSRNILQTFDFENFHESEKLVPNLMNKNNYIVYYKNLQLYLSLGIKLTKVHKVLSFKQKPWLKPYIEFNTNQRKLASSSFEKDFFKLLNNSVHGKTMENVRKLSNVQLVTSEKQAKKLVAAPTFKRFKIITESLVVLEKLKSCITLNRPIYIRFVILELSKVLMYNFHYNHIKKRYMDKANLLFTDTDSLTYEIETEDIYKDMGENLNIYDTSDYPQDHALYSEKNKKRICCFKDEMNSKPIIEFVSLRAKMYSMLTPDSEKKTAKGVSKVVIQQKLKHSNYLQCLKENKSTKENMILIKSENHDIYTVRQNKTALSSFDDKRYILDDNIGTFAYGHYKINENPI